MIERRYQVFISSTFRDLVAARQAVLLSVQRLNHIPAGMELFPSANDAPWDVIQRIIETSDYYVLIVGGRYGSTDAEGISFTEREYDLARDLGIPVLAFLHAEPGKLPAEHCEMEASARERLDAFRLKVEDRHHCTFWRNENELAAQVVVALVNEIAANARPGWVRGDLADEQQQLLSTLEQVRRRNDELESLLSAARADSAQLLDQLQQGNDEVELEYEVSVDQSIQRRAIPTTWQTVFDTIGYRTTSGMPEQELGYALAPLLSRECRFIKPSNSTTQQIRNQFIALGLLDVTTQTVTASRTSGPYSYSQAVWRLTEKGKHLYASSQAARRL